LRHVIHISLEEWISLTKQSTDRADGNGMYHIMLSQSNFEVSVEMIALPLPAHRIDLTTAMEGA
jgi:hypothetical protein